MTETGQKLVLSLQAGDKESASSWRQFFKDLKLRGLDGNKVTLGIMNGRMLLEKLQDERPKIKCLFMSGDTANVIAHHGVLDKGVHFIEKPFSPKDLAFKVRKTLGT